MTTWSTRTTYQGHAINEGTKQILAAMNKMLATKEFGAETPPATMLQGGYNKGGVAASAGTHDGGAAFDLTPFNWKNRVKALRLLGCASWHRPHNWDNRGGGEHIHTIVCGDGTASAGALSQVKDYYADRNGLANRAKDADVRPHGLPILFHLDGDLSVRYATQASVLRDSPSSSGASLGSAKVGDALTPVAVVRNSAGMWFVTADGKCGYEGHFSTTKPTKATTTPAKATTPPAAAKPTVTKPALRPARATGAAPAKIPSSMSKMYHVASNVWYAVEDSIYGLEAAEAGGYPWADIDIHVTKDGVMVCGHDTSPSDDHFVISAALKKKYGSHPNIENMTWADVSTLRTPPVKFGGKTITLRYYKVDEILAWMGEHPKVSVSFELKQSLAFEKPATFEALRDMAIEHGVDPKRLAIMSIARPAYNHLARFKAAHPYFLTMVLPHDLKKPSNWSAVQPFVDYYRGSWA